MECLYQHLDKREPPLSLSLRMTQEVSHDVQTFVDSALRYITYYSIELCCVQVAMQRRRMTSTAQ